MRKSQEQTAYEQSVMNRHYAFLALLEARNEEAKAKDAYEKACLQAKIAWLKYKEMQK